MVISTSSVNFNTCVILLLLGISLGCVFELCFLTREDGDLWIDLSHPETPRNKADFDVPNNSHNTQISVLCIIRIRGEQDLKKLTDSLSSWVLRCSGHVVVSDSKISKEYMKKINPSFVLHWRWSEWEGTREIWRFVHNKFKDDYNLFLITHVRYEIYIYVENLLAYVKSMTMASQLKPFVLSHMLIEDGFPYPSRKLALVLNKAAVRRFVNRLDYNDGFCKFVTWETDRFTFSRCLSNIGVTFFDARDQLGRLLFLPLSLKALITSSEEEISVLSSNYVNRVEPGFRCCSDNPIAFTQHGEPMYTLEFFIHRLKLAQQLQSRELKGYTQLYNYTHNSPP